MIIPNENISVEYPHYYLEESYNKFKYYTISGAVYNILYPELI